MKTLKVNDELGGLTVARPVNRHIRTIFRWVPHPGWFCPGGASDVHFESASDWTT